MDGPVRPDRRPISFHWPVKRLHNCHLLDMTGLAPQEPHRFTGLRAIQALRYAQRRKEGLVSWSFITTGVARKDLIAWAERKVQAYFVRV
jgi:hypothetical protein